MELSVKPLGSEYTLVLNDKEASFLIDTLAEIDLIDETEKERNLRETFLATFQKAP